MRTILNTNDVVYDRLVDHHIDVLRLSAGSADEAVRHIMECDRETCKLVNDHSDDEGRIGFTRIDSLLRKCLKLNDQCYQELGTWLEKELKETIHFEAQYAHSLLNEELRSARLTATMPSRSMLNAIIPEEPLVGGLLCEWITGLADGRFARLRAQIRIGYVQKESAFQIARRIRGTRVLNHRDGVAGQSIRSVRALVNTAYSHMINKARQTVYAANDDIVTKALWSAILDDSTCADCSAMDGELYDVDEIPPCPYHLNCRCMVVPIINPDDDEDFEFAPLLRLTYDQWLSKQKASRQDDILGPTRAAMFRRGMPLKKFVDSSGVRYNLSELRKIEAKIMAKNSKPPTKKSIKVLRNWGYRPDLPDQRDHLYGVVEPEQIALPVSVSMRDKMPPVWDQGSIGSCVAHACLASHMFVHKGEVMLSRLALYYNARMLEGMEDQDSGCMIRDAIKALAKFGDPPEIDWPYNIRKFKVDPPATVDREGLPYKITSYSRLLGNSDYQKCLAKGFPFVFGISVYENIYDKQVEQMGIMSMPPKDAQMLGGHALCCVGYDSNFHENPVFKRSGLSPDSTPNMMYEVRNSWGGRWGDGGYVWFPAEYLENRNMSDDFWTIRT